MKDILKFFEVGGDSDQGCIKCGSMEKSVDRKIIAGGIIVRCKCIECGFVWRKKYGLTLIDNSLCDYCYD